MAVNREGFILSLVTQGLFPLSEQTFEQSHTPLTIISAMSNSLHSVYRAKKSLSELFYS